MSCVSQQDTQYSLSSRFSNHNILPFVNIKDTINLLSVSSNKLNKLNFLTKIYIFNWSKRFLNKISAEYWHGMIIAYSEWNRKCFIAPSVSLHQSFVIPKIITWSKSLTFCHAIWSNTSHFILAIFIMCLIRAIQWKC